VGGGGWGGAMGKLNEGQTSDTGTAESVHQNKSAKQLETGRCKLHFYHCRLL